MTKFTLEKQLNVTYCNKAQTTAVKHATYSWTELAVLLTKKPKLVNDKDNSGLTWPLFVPFKMLTEEEGAQLSGDDNYSFYSRSQANIVQMDLLVLDFDNDPKNGLAPFTYDTALELFKGFECVLYTSYNHLNTAKHGGVEKFRVVLPLATPATLDEVKERKDALKELFPAADPASFTASQPFYVPIANPARANLHRSDELCGKRFDLLELEAAKKPEPTVRVVTTGEKLGDLPYIKLANGITYRADELFDYMTEGYEGKKACYRIDGFDKKPGCFVIKRATGISYHDNSGTSRFIKVYQSTFVNTEDEDDGQPVQLWIRKEHAQEVKQEQSLIDIVRARHHARPIVELDNELIHIDVRYLDKDLLHSFPKQGIIFIQSQKGTGKTEIISHITAAMDKSGDSCALLGHRVYLLQNLAIRTNLDFYRDLEHGAKSSALATCINSLKNIDPKKDTPFHTIIIDECEQVLQAFNSETLRKDLSQVFNTFVWLLRNAKRIICLDADLSGRLTVQLIQELRGDKPNDEFYGVINHYKSGAGKTTKMYANRHHMLSDCLHAADDGENIFIASNSRKQSTIFAKIIGSMGKKVLLITAETNEQEDTVAFIQNPTEECTKYDVVIASPTVSTGVSIDGNHFTKVFGFFNLNPGTYQDHDQALARVRNCNDVSVFIAGNLPDVKLPSEADIYYDALDREEQTRKKIFDQEANITQGEYLWCSMYARLMYETRIRSINKDIQFKAMREDLGFTVDTIAKDDELADFGLTIYNQFKDIDEDKALSIYDAEVIDVDAYDALIKKHHLSNSEYLAKVRYEYKHTLGDKFDLDTLRIAVKQELLHSLWKIKELYTLSDAYRLNADKDSRKKNKSTFTVNKHLVVQNELLDYLCNTAKVDRDFIYKEIAAGNEVQISIDTLDKVAEAYAERQKSYSMYFTLRIKDPKANAVKVWNGTLGKSLKLSIKKKKRGGNENRTVEYYIDRDAVNLVHEITANTL